MAKSELRTKVAILRAAIGISMKEFAALTGRTFYTWKALEAGRLKLSEDLAARISAETSVVMNWLLDDSVTGPPISQWGKALTRETFEYYRATLSAVREHDDRKSAAVKGRVIGDMLEEILDQNPERFPVAEYHADRFINQLAKDFLTPKAEESERKRPAPLEEESLRQQNEVHKESLKSSESNAEKVRRMSEVYRESLKESAESKKKQP